MSQDAEFWKAHTKAQLDLMQMPGATFVTTLALMMKQRIAPELPTAATDGLSIFYNVDFFLKLPRKQRATLMAHEAMHPAFDHIAEAASFNITPEQHKRFNKAADYVINDFLVQAGFEPIPGWCHDIKYRNMTTMQIYRLLEEEEAGGGGGGGGQEGPGEPFDDLLPQGWGEPEGTDPSAIEQAIKSNITAAAVATEMKDGKNAGSIPADVQVWLDGLLAPKLPMAAHLRKFFKAVDKSNYSWQKLNRRFYPMLMPGLQGRKLGHMAFAFDLSSSCSDKDIQRYVSELYNVIRMLKPERITLIQFTCELKSVHRIKTIQDLANVELRGRGGTCIEPVMEWARDNKPTALCVFTDGEYSHPSFNPGCPVMWMIHGYSKDMFECDFGTTIRFDVDDDPI